MSYSRTINLFGSVLSITITMPPRTIHYAPAWVADYKYKTDVHYLTPRELDNIIDRMFREYSSKMNGAQTIFEYSRDGNPYTDDDDSMVYRAKLTTQSMTEDCRTAQFKIQVYYKPGTKEMVVVFDNIHVSSRDIANFETFYQSFSDRITVNDLVILH